MKLFTLTTVSEYISSNIWILVDLMATLALVRLYVVDVEVIDLANTKLIWANRLCTYKYH